MKKIILSFGSILFVLALLVGGTGAVSAITQSSTGNTFTSGIVNFKIDNESYVTSTTTGKLIASPWTSWALGDLVGKLFFNFTDVKPGDIGEDTISLHNTGNDAWTCINIKLTGTPENGQPSPEAAVDPTAGVNAGELQNALQFAFWADDGDNVYEKGEKIFKQGSAKNLFTGAWWTLADSQGSVWGKSGTGWQEVDHDNWSDDDYTHKNKGQPVTASSTVYIAKAWCFGTLATAPVSQDGKGKTGTNGPLVRGTGFTCNGAPLGNQYQTDGISLNVNFEAIQSRDNGGFLCSGGKDSPPPPTNGNGGGTVVTGDASASAGCTNIVNTNGTTVGGGNINSSNIGVSNTSSASVNCNSTTTAQTGGNTVGGSTGGNGGNGGSISGGSGNSNNGAATTGNGGNGGSTGR